MLPCLGREFLIQSHYVLAYPRNVFPQTRIEVVLYRIISSIFMMVKQCVLKRDLPAFDDFRDFCPPVAHGLVSLDELHFLEIRPLLLIDWGVQVVVPSTLVKNQRQVYLSLHILAFLLSLLNLEFIISAMSPHFFTPWTWTNYIIYESSYKNILMISFNDHKNLSRVGIAENECYLWREGYFVLLLPLSRE